MHERDQLENIRHWVKKKLINERTGHDWLHISRVAELALYIGKEEHANLFVAEAAALVHDVIDAKLSESERLTICEVTEQLTAFGITDHTVKEIADIITRMSFRHRGMLRERPLSLEGKAVQDADMLDAIGAVGIGRAFMFAGAKGHPMYGSQTCVLAHFEEKLFRLKDLMNTKTGMRLAEERHEFFLRFAAQFEKEAMVQKR
ncbi:HD domain-containing protein [Bacillus sp. ISL-51]|uniref:HD domain-containing protein n=1 Tax=Bacteria TaxID=2 RepID=UPI001BEAC4F0|nr:HD domain-containing protein [Bacillus sp. ISL-51]MBT2575383.1 HD domain-containing protein [Bacillus sp. ISL-51]MBT2713020.1 HD domain-containing protein [Pseudomonas sp. ISL-88]